MKAFHGSQEIKDKYINRVKMHREADNLVQGKTWENGKGCAIGCTLEDYNPRKYETELGIPAWLAKVEDRLFEGMASEDAQLWPEHFLSAIKPGADTDTIKNKFLIFVVECALEKFDHDKFDKQAKYIKSVINKLKSKGTSDAAAYAAAYADYVYYVDDYAYVAVSAAADAAAYADYVYYVDDYAYVAVSAAADAAAYAAAADAKRSEYKKIADKLIELLESCN